MKVSLSAQEAKVATFRAQGLKATQIAELMSLAPHTVRSYLKTIHRKLNVTNAIGLFNVMSGGQTPDGSFSLRGKGQAQFVREQVATRDRSMCWVWPFRLHPSGYAVCLFEGKRIPAHRLAYDLDTGRTLPPELEACHSCDNTACFNPSHVEPGTHADNFNDMIKRNRHPLIKTQSAKPSIRTA